MKLERGSPLWWSLLALPWVLGGIYLLATQLGDGPPTRKVVVYCALDRLYAQPILEAFSKETGIQVLPKWDTEATKTTGLVQALRAEKNRVRCDVFWNNEVTQTIGLARDGLLQPYRSPNAEGLPRDAGDLWTGFAARARVLIVNTNLVEEGQRPTSYLDLTKPRWKGRVGIAKPLFGTTATHVAALFAALGPDGAKGYLQDLRQNDVVVCAGNADLKDRVAAGELAFGWTDTDDANLAILAQKPVTVVFPDQGKDQLGTLLIPNALAILKHAPHPPEAKALVDYLLRKQTEETLAKARSAQVPLRDGLARPAWIPAKIKTVNATWDQVADQFGAGRDYVRDVFLKE